MLHEQFKSSKVDFPTAVFCYALLYSLTENYIDHKHVINRFLKWRLSGTLNELIEFAWCLRGREIKVSHKTLDEQDKVTEAISTSQS